MVWMPPSDVSRDDPVEEHGPGSPAPVDGAPPGLRGEARTSVAALVGVVAAGLALAVSELVTGIAGESVSLVSAVGDESIDRLSGPLKNIAVELFGTNDKAALVVGIVIVSLLLGAGIGVASRRRSWVATVGFVAFGAVGAWAFARAAQTNAAVGVVAAAIAAGAGLLTLSLLLRFATPRTPAPVLPATAPADDDRPRAEPIRRPDEPSRRALIMTGAVGAVAVGVAASGRRLRSTDPAVVAARETVLPTPVSTATEPNQPFYVPGQSPYVTSNPNFYRIDTALVIPRVDASRWKLEITGLVDRPFSLTYDELLAMDTVEEFMTLRCVSDEVGGDLVGNAKWQGVPLQAVLDRAGVQPGAEQLFSTSTDGWTCGFPVAHLQDHSALIAVAMNGVPLPTRHGYPARLVVAGLYGYVSATKWLRKIELTTWDGRDGYWVPRGWSKEGPQKVGSRIDTPKDDATRGGNGKVAVAGVAWAPGRGISGVEVRIDEGAWQPCRLGAVANENTWVQWVYEWDATPGEHTITCRAVAADGEVQTDEVAPPDPDGSTGHHTVRTRLG